MLSLRSTDEPPEPASILVGHAETILPVLSLLGLYKEQTPPTASDFEAQQGTDRRLCLREAQADRMNLTFFFFFFQRDPL